MRTIKQLVISLAEKLYNLKKLHKLIFLSLLTFALTFIMLFASDVSISYNVRYNGKRVAQVESTSVYFEGAKMALDKVSSENPEQLMEKPFFFPVLTINGGKSSSEDVANEILNNSPKIIKGYSVTLDSQQKLFVSNDAEFNSALNARLESFAVENGTTSFTNAVALSTVYCANVDFASEAEQTEFVNSLNVMTEVNTVKTIEIPYKTVTQKTTAELAGYNQVSTKGEKGEKQETHNIKYLNGQVIEDTTTHTAVLKEAVNEVVVVGVGKSYYTAAEKMASSYGFIWPLNKNVRGQFIVSYWGDGRGHKGIDICSPYGTSIYAANGGTVEYASWNNDYGYNVIINHGNGLKTRYAHASKLLVKKGETVTQGQTIALVGSTGQSTGNHLHFEVILNGTRVNPMPYLANS